jgi:hypothetical protein
VYNSDHTVLGDSSSGSAQAAVIMKSQVNVRMEIYRKIATRVGSLWIISQATGTYFGVIPDCSMVRKILLIMLSVMSCSDHELAYMVTERQRYANQHKIAGNSFQAKSRYRHGETKRKYKHGINLTPTKQTKHERRKTKKPSLSCSAHCACSVGLRGWIWYSYVFTRLFYYEQF